MKTQDSIVVYDEDEGIYGDRSKTDANVWDRKPKVIDTGLLDPYGRKIKRRTKGMDPVGFIRFWEMDI